MGPEAGARAAWKQALTGQQGDPDGALAVGCGQAIAEDDPDSGNEAGTRQAGAAGEVCRA